MLYKINKYNEAEKLVHDVLNLAGKKGIIAGAPYFLDHYLDHTAQRCKEDPQLVAKFQAIFENKNRLPEIRGMAAIFVALNDLAPDCPDDLAKATANAEKWKYGITQVLAFNQKLGFKLIKASSSHQAASTVLKETMAEFFPHALSLCEHNKPARQAKRAQGHVPGSQLNVQP